ncbi:ribosome small subunit-dependent GTPase A [Thalassotalea litorea]|uniref:Small ribosomal subunit biogenesis GTPase RsgA n=1 Tax=Thalassotalea litorea TaxID=2020715 RepID=A0A5R9IGT6_9GAMM|nr:ribosome small subunit-dependent GTPase A [Thalassotalea litorea]TLU61860.1 ribosome small subunit-dependent GTPase A [Thalassotalea litorea]
MNKSRLTLAQLGWRPFFQQQLSLEEYEDYDIGRVVEHHRSQVKLAIEGGAVTIELTHQIEDICVGDWVLFDQELRLHRVLERQSLFARKAPGTKVDTQRIAANIDVAILVSSLNQDFNLSRIERYLVLVREAGVEPLVVLTKADLCDDPQALAEQVQQLDNRVSVVTLNALSNEQVQPLSEYYRAGDTLVLLGSSGVGKSTLANTLIGETVLETAGIREDDSKGRHTTTYRSLQLLPSGGLILDTPGMRELQLGAAEQGVKETFKEIIELAERCRFGDCSHTNEPGCEIQKALKLGELNQRRFQSFEKLMREQAFNSATLAQKRAKDKAFGKMINSIQNDSRSRKRGK